jgi:osmoprotectant transport system permease protein
LRWWQHIVISVTSLSIAFAISLVVGIVAARNERVFRWSLGVSGLLYTVPTLAFLALLIPIVGLGRANAIICMVAFSLMIMIRNVATGLREVPADVVEAAKGMGMSGGEILRRIELPLALPVIVAGLRIATVTVISVAVVAAYVNAGGLGTLIFNRHQQRPCAENLDRCIDRLRTCRHCRHRALAARALATPPRDIAPPHDAARRSLAVHSRASGAIPRRAGHAYRAVGVGTRHRDRDRSSRSGVLLSGTQRAAQIAISGANIGRTLPSLAVLALVMPVLGTGFVPSLFALTLLALPPILINTYTAVRQVEPEVVDAARGMGMTRNEIRRKVEVPLALPVIFAGIRTAAVQVISGAVLAAYIGGGGLGDFITAGIAMNGAAAASCRRDSSDAARVGHRPPVRGTATRDDTAGLRS